MRGLRQVQTDVMTYSSANKVLLIYFKNQWAYSKLTKKEETTGQVSLG